MKTLGGMLLLVSLAAWPSQVRAAEESDVWAVVGIREAGGRAGRDLVEGMRAMLVRELRGSARMLDEQDTMTRLGLQPAKLRAIEKQIDSAELYYFQLELDVARRNLEQALDGLSHAGGEPLAWERTRMARLLLAMVHLAAKTEAGRRLATEQLEALIRVQPEYRPDERAYPPSVLKLYAEARKGIAALPRGSLRMQCDPACPAGHVWVDTLPKGVPGERIELPAGRYRVVVTDTFERPQARSLVREIVIEPGEETGATVNLDVEGRLQSHDGPSFALAPGRKQGAIAAEITSRQLRVDRLVILWWKPMGPVLQLHAGLLAPDGGSLERAVSVEMGSSEPPGPALEDLARLLLRRDEAMASAAALPSAPMEDPPPPPVASVPEAALSTVHQPLEPGLRTLTLAKWSTAGAAVLAGGIGAWLSADAEDRAQDLRGQLRAWGGSFPSTSDARASAAEMEALNREGAIGTGLLVGAGVAAATAVTLFLLDGPSGDAGSVSPSF